MEIWIIVGVVLALVLGGALLLDRRRGGGRVDANARDDHTQAAAEAEANRARQQSNGYWGG